MCKKRERERQRNAGRITTCRVIMLFDGKYANVGYYRKFGKTLLKQQIPEYAASYINYKALKKLISSIEGDFKHSENVEEAQRRLQANKAAFFFKLERELEKVNMFYLQKEAELQVRLRVLVEKEKLLRLRSSVAGMRKLAAFTSLQEGFQTFERDLYKLQQFVELNATGFSKALKKWDKRSKSHTKELYLSRQVEIQPCFNREVISNLSDTAASCLLELSSLADGEQSAMPAENGAKSEDERHLRMISGVERRLEDLESELLQSLHDGDVGLARNIIKRLEELPLADQIKRITSVFLRSVPDVPFKSLEILVLSGKVDFDLEDEITGRAALQEAAIAGRLDALNLCLDHGASSSTQDIYGRAALHYACIHSQECASALVNRGAQLNVRDHDELTPLMHAIIHGKSDCVKELLIHGASIVTANESFVPLNLACEHGHLEIAKLLLAQKAQISPNAEGLFPQHLAARAGNVGFLPLLQRHGADLDLKEKFNLWTPMHFAASEGHTTTLKELIDLGCLADPLDEDGQPPVFYAAWHGYVSCMDLLLSVASTVDVTKRSSPTPETQINDSHLEPEGIPSLELPPPIIPFRIYGHNYLDKTTYIQITLGLSHGSSLGAVKLYEESSITSAKLTIIPKGSTDGFPRSALLPLGDETDFFSFQVDDIEHFSLEVELSPMFGSQIIGRTVALSHLFNPQIEVRGHSPKNRCTLPILNPNLKAIGEFLFEFSVIKPFAGVQLEIGGQVETYWKSTGALNPPPLFSHNIHNPQTKSTSQFLGNQITASSLFGHFVRFSIQVTRDGTAVVYPSWRLPVEGLDVSVTEVTYDQFRSITTKSIRQRDVASRLRNSTYPEEAQAVAFYYYDTLAEALVTVPPAMNIELQIVYPTDTEQVRCCTDYVPEINTYVDAVLETVFHHAQNLGSSQKRLTIFSSYNPNVCTVLNWKQPNCNVTLIMNITNIIDAVFFGTHIGTHLSSISTDQDTSALDRIIIDQSDRRCTSLREAVKFARTSNLLGLICEASILVSF